MMIQSLFWMPKDVYKRQCSYNIIMSTEIIGLSHLEREIIANVVRYNIRDFDYDKVQLETQVHQEEDIGCLLYTSRCV